MLDYKHRWIELTPRRDTHDGTWRCQFMIIGFKHTSWSYHQGYANGTFASRDAAKSAALEKAKRLVDTLEQTAQDPRPESGLVLEPTRAEFEDCLLRLDVVMALTRLP